MIDINLNEKILICHTPCGPTYRESTVDKLTNYYFDHPNLYILKIKSWYIMAGL